MPGNTHNVLRWNAWEVQGCLEHDNGVPRESIKWEHESVEFEVSSDPSDRHAIFVGVLVPQSLDRAESEERSPTMCQKRIWGALVCSTTVRICPIRRGFLIFSAMSHASSRRSTLQLGVLSSRSFRRSPAQAGKRIRNAGVSN